MTEDRERMNIKPQTDQKQLLLLLDFVYLFLRFKDSFVSL
jgi:hypothetical protein